MMQRKIDPADQALIEDAIRRGMVRVIPRGVSQASVLEAAGEKPVHPYRRYGKPPSPVVAARRNLIKRLNHEGLTVAQIVEKTAATEITVRADIRLMGLVPNAPPKPPASPRKRGPKSTGQDKAAAKRAKAVSKGVAAVAAIRSEAKDRRRFKLTPVPKGKASHIAPKGMTGTLFQERVRDVVPGEPVLIDGASNSKIGGDVLVGWLKGAKIFTLTLEERATCPDYCPLWDACYGNGLNWSIRWRPGPALEAQIEDDVKRLCAKHGTILVRLHITGDFYSEAYVQMWNRLLWENPGLNVFGFTMHRDDSELGRIIGQIRGVDPKRFSIRHSGRSGPWGSITTDAVEWEKPMILDAAICPEQRGAMAGDGKGTHCGSCGLCWKGQATPIVFFLH